MPLRLIRLILHKIKKLITVFKEKIHKYNYMYYMVKKEGRKMLNITKKITSLIIAITMIAGISVTASAVSPHIISNVSNYAVTTNLSNGSLPTSLNKLKVNTNYHFNIASDTTNKFTRVNIYVKRPGDNSYHLEDSIKASGFLRYADSMINTGSKAGILRYYWVVVYKGSNKSEKFRVRTIEVLGESANNNSNSVSARINSALTYIKSQVGKSLDYDGVYGSQCVDLIKYYYQKLGVSPVAGNGKDYVWNRLPNGFTRIKGCRNPQPGDILVYTNGKYGHVAIYVSDNESYHQNYNNVQRVQKVTKKYNSISGYWGVIRPSV